MTPRLCETNDCGRVHFAKGLCYAHYRRLTRNSTKTGPIGDAVILTNNVYMPCPDTLLDLADQVAENDARVIFRLLWRAIGDWHLQGLLEETA